jgi:hypothetical protein
VPSEAASNATSAQAVTAEVQDKDSCVDALTKAVSEQLCVSGRAVVPVMPAAAQGQPGLMPITSNRCAAQCMAHVAAGQTDSCNPAGAAAGIEQLPKLGRHLAAPSVAEQTAAARQQGSSASDFAEPFCQDGGEYAALENMVSTSAASCR